ncbi:DNA-binding protein [uncultured Abiotrophia sp.]|uniref:DNA-binding protein n=2 Tax=Abiotrophia TaxID=46123 RepID=UPI0028D6CAB4|nr:DNA-binding protein [uncultured Abiotrophia sp.]
MEVVNSILSKEASMELVRGILGVVSQKVEEASRSQQKQILNQSELFKAYDCNYRDVERWLKLGLKRRRQGQKWMYDRRDVEAILEIEKEAI